MKRTLLVLTAAMAMAGVNAQTLKVSEHNVSLNKAGKQFMNSAIVSNHMEAKTAKATLAVGEKQEIAVAGTKKNLRKSKEDGLYYSKPSGCPYIGWGLDGMGFGNTLICAQAYTPFSFTDWSTPPAIEWVLEGQSGEVDITEYVIDGKFTTSLEPKYQIGVPTIRRKASSWQMGTANDYYAQGKLPYVVSGDFADMHPLTFLDDHGASYGWGSLSTDNLYGTGDIQGSPCIAVIQDLPKPASPIYADAFFASGMTVSGTIGEVKMEIYNLDSESEEPVYVLTATDDDFISWGEGSRNGVTITSGNLQFSQKSEDAFGSIVNEPIIIDFPAEVVFTGFDKCDFGLRGLEIQPEDEESFTDEDGQLMEALFGVAYPDGVKYHYYSGLALQIGVNGVIDNVLNYGDYELEDGTTYPSYYVQISDDGTENKNMLFSDVAGAIALTTFPWFSEEGDENYYAELPEWIQGCSAELLGEDAGFYQVSFVADPLPEGESRGAFVYIQGRGVEIDIPFFVFQGEDIEAAWDMAVENDSHNTEDAIHNVVANSNVFSSKTFNIAGQNVSDNFKGIVIKNGKKYLNK